MVLLGKFFTDDSDNHDDSSQKKHEDTFGSDAEKMIENVKRAISNGEGCRVCYLLNMCICLPYFQVETAHC